MNRIESGLCLLALLVTGPVYAAAPDNNVEWDGITHYGWQDRRPLCPVSHESFQVRIQTWQTDITSMRIFTDDGGVADTLAGSQSDTRGPYDIWTAQIPATTNGDLLTYYFELTDGTDTDYYGTAGMTATLPAGNEFNVDFSTLEHAPVGGTVTSSGAVFKVWAPTATTAHVRGDFNSWGLTDSMTKLSDHFIVHVPAASVGDEYKYYFSGGIWKQDPRARSLNSGSNYNSILIDPLAYTWTVDDFDTPDLEEMVIYQLHVGTFAGRNDPYGTAPDPARFIDVAVRAYQLADLGVNAVMINPITEFPWDFSAGYNPITAWSPESKYGSPDYLRSMVDSLHAHGIAVILDVVWNHFSFDDNFLWEYDGGQIYYDTPALNTPWGDQADFDNSEVREYFLQSAAYWHEEFKIDGWRMDATDFMNIPPQDASGWSLMQEFNNLIDTRWAGKVTIAEQLPDDSWVTRPTSLSGAGFDTQYYDQFTDDLRQEIFDAAVGNPEIWKIRDIINGGGSYLNGKYATNYVELHDEAWPSSGGQRIVKSIDTVAPHNDEYAKGRTKLANGVVMFAPGVPAMLMGNEWLEDTDFGTDATYKIDWSKKTTYAGIFQYYQDIIALRTGNPALRADASHQVFHENEGGNVIAWQRWDGSGNVFVIIANFSNTDYMGYRVGLPQSGDWTEMVNSQNTTYEGDGLVNAGTITTDAIAADGFSQSALLTIPKMGLLVLKEGAYTGTPSTPPSSNSSLRFETIRPNPARGEATVFFRLPETAPVKLSVYDVRGRLVARLMEGEQRAGTHAVTWNGDAASGADAPAGVYFLRLEAGGERATRKMVILR